MKSLKTLFISIVTYVMTHHLLDKLRKDLLLGEKLRREIYFLKFYRWSILFQQLIGDILKTV